MDQQSIFLTILGMATVTYIPRLLPAWLLPSRTLPRWLVVWLRNVPVAVLAAMVFPTLASRGPSLAIDPRNLYLLAAFPTLLVAWKTRSLFGSVITGVILVAVGRHLLPP
ncbi:MAG: AzlD domain-containing protein [Anaerolineae bacterium]|jgi:branched-subunit amino acid transport protein